MNNQTTAELRGILRGALAANERARVMAADAKLSSGVQGWLMKSGLSILAAIAHLEDEETVAKDVAA